MVLNGGSLVDGIIGSLFVLSPLNAFPFAQSVGYLVGYINELVFGVVGIVAS